MDAIKTRHWIHRLNDEYDHLCYTYRVKLRRPVIRILTLDARWAQWEEEIRTLSFSENLLLNQPWEIVVEVLKHEMAHQIVSEDFGADEGHGPLFHRACDRLAIAPWARRAEAELGQPPPDWRRQSPGSEEERLLQRVEKLLRLANSSNSHEALAAMKKVQELYLKYHLDRPADERSASHRGLFTPDRYVYLPIRLKRKRVERYHSAIAALLQDFFRVEVIHTSHYDSERNCDLKVIEILGRKEDVALAEYVFHFLLNQLPILWRMHGEKGGLKKQNSFYLGVLAGFREKLEIHQSELTSQNRSMALMLRQRDEGLEDYLSYRYPRVVRIQHGRLMQDGKSYDHGRSHGRELVLRRGLDAAASVSGRLLPRA